MQTIAFALMANYCAVLAQKCGCVLPAGDALCVVIAQQSLHPEKHVIIVLFHNLPHEVLIL